MFSKSFKRRATRALGLSVVLGCLALPQSGWGASQVLTFEGLQNNEAILQFYNGGAGSLGSIGPDYDIEFGSHALALKDSDAGGSGNFANEPSPDTIAFFLSGPGVVMNVPGGFQNGFSFFYTSSGAASVTVYDGLNGGGNVLGTLSLSANWTDDNCVGDPTGSFCHWDPVGVTFAGTARSVNFGGAANQAGFDEVTIGSSTPGSSNRPPTAVNDAYTHHGSDTPLTVAAPGVLANDTDADSDPLTASQVTGPSNGSLVLGSDGSFSYRPNPGFVGQDSFSYKASDGTAESDVATVTITVRHGCDGRAATIIGTSGNDNIVGTSGGDVIVALGGDDDISAGGGDDAVCGDSGQDDVSGSGGGDYLHGGAGDSDRLSGGDGGDRLDGAAGRDDICSGGSGTDSATAGCERTSGVP